MLPYYKDNVLIRAEDLLRMPAKPFQYYIFGFCNFVMKMDFGFYESSDAASSFLNLVSTKLKDQPDVIKPIMPKLIDTLEFIASNQKLYEADEDIYGNFDATLAQIIKLSGEN